MVATATAPIIKTIYLTVGLGQRNEQMEFSSADSDEDVKDLFRAAGEASELDVLKLFNENGHIINISVNIKANSPESRYRLDIVTTQSRDLSAAAKFGVNLSEIEQRLGQLLDQILLEKYGSSEQLTQLRAKVEHLREKLENYHHLSWLGMHKELASSSPTLEPFWKKHKTAPRSHETFQRIFDKANKLSHSPLAKDIQEYLKKPSFSNWQWDDAEMIVLLRQMFVELQLHQKCNFSMTTLMEFLFTVYRRYNDIPFHNFKHCFMVAQMMYSLIHIIPLDTKLDEYELLALIVAPICHDLDHPGYNNAYQVNARSDLAMMYNDLSPLENHHCSVAFEILNNPNCDLFANLDKENYRRIREMIIKLIMATDMGKHVEILTPFKAIIPTFDVRIKEHKELLTQICMKVSDISNEARPIDAGATWLDCLLEEFFNQSDMEKLEGLPVAPFMDREKVTKPVSQIGFIKFVLLPLYESLGELYPHIVADVVDPVRKALEYYSEMHQAYELEKKRKEEARVAAANAAEGKDTTATDPHHMTSPNKSENRRELPSVRRNLGWNPKTVSDSITDASK